MILTIRSNDFGVFETTTNNFLDANQITNGNIKRACFPNDLSEETYLLPWNLCTIPDTPEINSYEDLVETLDKDCRPVKTYYGARHKLYTYCKYGIGGISK